MDRRATPSKRVTSPTWGSPPPCKQALRKEPDSITINVEKNEQKALTLTWLRSNFQGVKTIPLVGLI